MKHPVSRRQLRRVRELALKVEIIRQRMAERQMIDAPSVLAQIDDRFRAEQYSRAAFDLASWAFGGVAHG